MDFTRVLAGIFIAPPPLRQQLHPEAYGEPPIGASDFVWVQHPACHKGSR